MLFAGHFRLFLACRRSFLPHGRSFHVVSSHFLLVAGSFLLVVGRFLLVVGRFRLFRVLVSMQKYVFQVACRVQVWKKALCQNNDKFGYCVIYNDIIYMYILCIYQKTIILGLFKIDTLNCTMYILTTLTCPLKIYVIRLHNLTSMKIFFTEIKIIVFLYNCKETNKLLK